MYAFLGITQVLVLTFRAHECEYSVGLNRSSPVGYWKAKAPYLGVKGEA